MTTFINCIRNLVSNRGSQIVSFVVILLLFQCLNGCSRGNQIMVDVPAGVASHTLKEFARQSRVEIIFDAASIEGVRTNAVSGRMTPESAIKSMLTGTSLAVERDRETGAFAVTYNNKPKVAAN